MWNTKFLLWGLFKSSTWNLVVLTFERELKEKICFSTTKLKYGQHTGLAELRFDVQINVSYSDSGSET